VVFMGADTYEKDLENGPRMGIGKNCHIRNAIIDKDAHIGDGAVLINKDNLENAERDGIIIKDGIIIVPKGVNVPAKYVL
jgi:glucose-1-phosphate adenylyltransferase